ncbi:MAG: hypothetical protein ABSF57_07010 [Acidobacteriaceae bacterium]|jgi:hypothetical protein
MPKTPIAEWLLARITDPTRAAAIMGDLTEMAGTRGLLWFWTAYARTLISLGWRTPVALLVTYAYLHSIWVLRTIQSSMHWLFRWVPYAHPAYQPPVWWFYLRPLWSLLTGLYFLAPFLLVRFGLRDRLTRLASALLLLVLTGYSNRLLLDIPVEALTAVAVFVALCLRAWRRPMVVLALCLAPRLALLEASPYIDQYRHRALFHSLWWIELVLMPIATALLCLWLYRRMLRSPAAVVA